MKQLIITLLLLSHSFLAMAEDNSTKVELLKFIKENNVSVGKVIDNSMYSYTPPLPNIPYSISFYSENEINNNFDKIFNDINVLYFEDLNITNLPLEALSIIPNLEVISIKNMTLKSFPKIDTLKQISFFNVNFNEIEKDVFKNINLVVLYILDSNLQSLSKDIANLTNLQLLNLSNNKLLELPIEIEDLTNLETLDLSNNNLEKLPNSILKLKLITLKLTNNNLKTLPSDFGDIDTLKYLDLRNNRLKYLPDSFLNLKEFAYLFLNNNDLRELPKDFFTIFQKQYVTYNGALWPGSQVDISNNKISFFDKSICKVNRIYRLNFYNNYLNIFPNCITNMSASNLWVISSIFGYEVNPYNLFTNITNSSDINMGKFVEKAGWSISDKLITIDYFFENNKTITFNPILGNDFNITSYLWNFGDGNSSTEEMPTHTYSNYGDYNVTLTINSGEYNASKLITISPRVLELKKGWNMITSPTKDDINASIFESVWSYENEKWENTHNFLIPTIGYWIKLNEDLNYSYSGEVYTTPSYKIKDGWNLIGNGEKMINFDENSTYYIFRDNSWIKNPKEVKIGEGVWIKKE